MAEERIRRYRVILEPEEDGGYAVWVPTLPGCVSQGDTRAEALANIREAIRCYLESAAKHGEAVPNEELLEEATVEVAV
ncbi:MAG: type II toxin-antitoxin system HicB family antitoxin [candidate division NC10 bacterium]|nr:type II toxin-antitoxin system HicB family antitoxin [candidate division NC10 bacterium]